MKRHTLLLSLVGAVLITAMAGAQPQPTWTKFGTTPIDFRVNYAGFLDSQFGITVGYAGEVHRSTDGGTSWPRAQNNTLCRFGLEIVDRNVAYHCGNGSQVARTSDGGKTWSLVANFAGGEPVHARYLSFFHPDSGWIAAPGLLGSTVDGGKTWSEIPLPEGMGAILSLSCLDARRGAVFDNAGVLWRTGDGGQTWTSSPVVAEEFLSDVTATPTATLRWIDAQHLTLVFFLYAEKSGWTVRSTADGGTTWNDQLIDEDLVNASPWLDRTARFLTLTTTNSSLTLYAVK